jgi:ABC transport system ATP-binding/permease protein
MTPISRARPEDRIREMLAERGVEAPDDAFRLVLDFCQVLVTSHDGVTCAEPSKIRTLAGILATRTKLEQDVLVDIVRLATAPGLRETHNFGELAAFEARFGSEAAASISAGDATIMDLAGFSRVYGSADAMMLLEALLVVSTTPKGIEVAALPLLRAAADELGVDAKLFGALLRKHDPRHAKGELTFSLKGDEVGIGRSPGNEVVLLDPQVAPRHARLVRSPTGWRVADAGSGRLTVLDGQAVRNAPFSVGQRLRVGPYTLWLADDGNTLVAEGAQSFSALSIRHVSRRIGKLELLSDISFTVFSGEVVAVVGPSGSGKTSLLNAITGVSAPDEGEILLDGANFHNLLEFDRSMVGIVPQDDLVHPELTVVESLRYAGQIRFSGDVTPHEIDEAVDRVLVELDIESIRDSRIGDVQRRGISGGQRKRVNLGQELLTRSTRILFLDEPTSGLDPRAAQDILHLVRRLADDGRIVFIVTHDLTPAILSQVDHLLVLAPGGHLAFFGPRAEACAFFRVASPDGIFHQLDERAPEEWARSYCEHATFQKYVGTREYLVQSGGLGDQGRDEAPKPHPGARSLLQELATHISRYTKVKRRDRLGAVVLVAQPILLGLVMWIVFPFPTAAAIFMLCLSSLWFGMSSSVRELIADRPIWRRERRIGARILPFVGSKVLVLGAVVLLQCLYLTGFLFVVLGLQSYGFSFLELFAVQGLTGLAGMSLGLLVSALLSSSEAAVGALPLLLVPQIAFSSIMIQISRMSAFARLFTWLTIQRYALDGALRTGSWIEFYSDQTGWVRMAQTGTLYILGLKPSDANRPGLSLPACCAALAVFVVAQIAATLLVTRNRDKESA